MSGNGPHRTSHIDDCTSSISLIVAMTRNRVIGRDGQLPWRLPDDLKWFKQVTAGHTVIMGRVTWQSLGRPLSNRRNIVVSRNAAFHPEGAESATTLEEALRMAGEGEVFVIGGEQVYAAAIGLAHRIYLTRIDTKLHGDAFFPEFDLNQWHRTSAQPHEADGRHAWPFTFEVWERKVGA